MLVEQGGLVPRCPQIVGQNVSPGHVDLFHVCAAALDCTCTQQKEFTLDGTTGGHPIVIPTAAILNLTNISNKIRQSATLGVYRAREHVANRTIIDRGLIHFLDSAI
ncbi:MAG: hypothetical protein NTV69_03740 [Caldilinea sp.]|nr:hypothetical protein [Caldilinea sp.]